ncbi:Peptidyl-prolyl cis-trans isomerase pin4, partial [Ancistrocladus abbreviatus]
MIGYQGFPGRPSNFGGSAVAEAAAAELYTSRGPTSRPSNFEENNLNSPRFGFYAAQTVTGSTYPAPNPEFAQPSAATATANKSNKNQTQQLQQEMQNKLSHDAKELHMFVWSSSASPVSEVGGLHVFGSADFSTPDQSGRSEHGAKEIRMLVSDQPQNGGTKGIPGIEEFGGEHFRFVGGRGTSNLGEGDEEREKASNGLSKLGSSSAAELQPKLAEAGGIGGSDSVGGKQMPPASVMTRLILIMVWRKLIRNPNTYSSLVGLVWSLIAFRWHVAMPKIIEKSISILSDAGLGMAMFSL